ncbi:MAG: Gfo/Idh/MocA family oxidoreductase [Planctomycetia bacterium]|nr:Gfo/Idh/MocA family oxidoreductase [Planctomycetia bacterium]
MKKTSHTFTRRQFLAASTASIFLPSIIPGSAVGLNGKLSANSRLITMVIGVGSRGPDLQSGAMRDPNFQVIGVCDCNKKHLIERGQNRINNYYKNKDCLIFSHYEDILARKDVDVIINATPDHWHTKITVEACIAGKDVYCEKPLTLTPMESHQIVRAARMYNRVVTGGSQRVMEDYGYIAPIIRSGAIGHVKEAYVTVGNPPKECYLPAEKEPEYLDWDRWQGQAPVAAYHPERCSGSYGGGWRNYSEYGNGFLADWGAHKFGGTLYIMGLDDQEPVEILPPESPENPNQGCCAIYKNGFKLYHRGAKDICFVGSERNFNHGDDRNKVKPLHSVDIRRYHGGAKNIMADFAYCVRNRLRPFQDVAYAANTATLCQLMNICYKVNRPLKWDSEKCVFIGDEQATKMVLRPQRFPYVIPVI